jgi:hypothetical protein
MQTTSFKWVRADFYWKRHAFLLSLIFLLCCTGALSAQQVPGEGLQLWLRADQPGKVDESGGVAVWQNGAPNAGQHAEQPVPSRRPRWIESASSLGGRPALEFDGRDDFLHMPWLEIGADATVILVAENCEQTEGGSYWRTVIGGDDDSFRDGATKYSFGFRRGGLERQFIANLYYAPAKPHRLMEPSSPPTQVGFHVYGFLCQGESTDGMTLRVDGATAARLTADKTPPGFPGKGYTIGQGGNLTTGKLFRFYRGRIAEILIYSRALAPIEVLQVEEYLSEKYDLQREYAPPTRGLVLWLDAVLLPASKDSDTRISRWEDQSGQEHHALQLEPTHRPDFLRRGVNRRPAVEFDGVSEQLDFSGWKPPTGGTVYASVRTSPSQRGRILRELPAIDSNWAEDAQRFRGLLSELLVYDRALSADEAESVEHYLDYRYSESPDARCFHNGRLIFDNGYNDQPYVVKCRDGSWLCVITTSAIAESGADRTLVVTRSRDAGYSWSEPTYSIEPAEMRQPSWATLYVAPYGRVYVFYNLREEHPGPSPVGFFFKYSDDHGESWSAERYRIPIRSTDLDRRFDRTGGWSVCPPLEVDDKVLLSYTRYGRTKRAGGQGFVFQSDNLQTERDARRIRWQMLPAGNLGIRADGVESEMQEEHIITPLSNGNLFCLWRTTAGYACQSYSRDCGQTWGDRDFAVYQPHGRRIKQPLACCRPYRTTDGRYLLWFHNAKPAGETAIYRPRDVVWLAGGKERDGVIHWSQPELLLYGHDLPVRGIGMSYPDFIEQDGRLWITTTDKEEARIFEIDPGLLEGLWNQGTRPEIARGGLTLDLENETLKTGVSMKGPPPPSLLHGGFTVHLRFRLEKLAAGQTLVECCGEAGNGWKVTTAESETLQIELNDSRHTSEGWTTDPGLLKAGRWHQVTFVVDGGPNLILVLLDGMLCDGGDENQRGWGRFSPRLTELCGNGATLRIPRRLSGTIARLRVYDRPLRVSEVLGIHQHDSVGAERAVHEP